MKKTDSQSLGIETARKLLRAGTSYEVIHRGNVVRVIVPPSACHECGGDGCKVCKFTGENLPA